MTILGDIILSVSYVASGTVYSVTEETGRHINATGRDWQEHVFEHPFLLMAFEFVAQALCIPLWLIITGGVTPHHNPIQNNPVEGATNNTEGQAEDEPLLLSDNNPGLNVRTADNHDQDDAMIGTNDANPERLLELVPNNPTWHKHLEDKTKFNKFIFVLPAFFDLSRYVLLYIALKLTYSSSYVMNRGVAVLFTVLLRVAFLSKSMAKYMWVSIGMVIVGLGFIGMTNFVYNVPSGYDKYGIAAGCLLIIMSQIMIAMQIVYEEKFMDKYSIHPLRVVGLEGIFGSIVAVVLLIPFSFIEAGPFNVLYQGHLVDIKDAFLQMKSSWILALCVVGRVVSKVVYYYTGTWLVRNQHDAAKRITIDVHHDLIIWTICLTVGWQKYFYPQIIGYILVPLGMLVYCDIIPLSKVFQSPPEPLPNEENVPLNDQNEVLEEE